MPTKRDFTATTLVVHNGRVLLHPHRKLGLVLPLGGHVEADELPDDAALREVFEESGLEVELVHSEPVWPLSDVRQLARPVAVLLEDIEPGHQHIDLIYVATLREPGREDGHPAGNGSEQLLWLAADELDRVEMPANVRALARYALELVENEGRNGGAKRADRAVRRRGAGERNDMLPRPDGPQLA